MMFSVLAVALFAQAAFAAPLTRRADPIPSAADIARLAPDLGALPNTNPNQSGDCDGPKQLDGKIPRVPCQCPPLHDAYIQALTTNVLAGHAVNNTVVNIGFPTGDSLNDKHGRITAAIITLQNLNGPGKGCPGVSTTLGIQSKNLDTCGDFFCNGAQPSENTGAVPATGSSGETSTASAAEPSPSATSSDTAAPTETPAQNNDSGNGNNNGGAQSTVTVTSVTVVTSTETVTRGQETATASAGGNNSGNGGGNNGNNGNNNNNNGGNNDNNNNNGGNNNNNNGGNNNNSGVLTRDLVDQLAPELGSQPNNNPNQFGDCDGPQQPDGKIPRVPCQCPPTRDVFIDQLFANIQAGHALKNPTVGVNFPTGNSKADQHARITASVITLQNLDGPGKGCPGVSTTFAAQSNAIDAA